MESCDCKEKIVLEDGDGSFIAYESWCPKHGYYTSCYKCNPNSCSTEVCRKNHLIDILPFPTISIEDFARKYLTVDELQEHFPDLGGENSDSELR